MRQLTWESFEKNEVFNFVQASLSKAEANLGEANQFSDYARKIIE